MDILRFFTAGNVDDGKSTLIGRLLIDSGAVSTDILETLTRQSKTVAEDVPLDLALITDGLRDERQQGITIDVAYKFFTTAKRKYIIADTPGHEQYTRNMFTGASTADAGLILLDARKGITEQTRRHVSIASVLRIPHILVCINKMDLVDRDEQLFSRLVAEFKAVFSGMLPGQTDFIPVAALTGENIVHKSDQLRWYNGPTLFEWLETCEPKDEEAMPGRFRVQYVLRPQSEGLHDYRGYAGIQLSGKLFRDTVVRIFPGNHSATISAVSANGKEEQSVASGQPAVLQFSEDLDIGRGSLVCADGELPLSRSVKARICWMDDKAFSPAQKFLFQQQSFRTKAMIKTVLSSLDLSTFSELEQPEGIRLNEIATIELKLADEILIEPFAANRALGSFILINEATNQTVAGGVIE